MADRAKKISELTTATAFANTDFLIIVANTSGTAITKNIRVSSFISTLSNTANLSFTNFTVANTLTTSKLLVGSPTLVSGVSTTRAAVLAEVSNTLSVGSMYISTAGKMYLKTANTYNSTDWQRVTTTAAD